MEEFETAALSYGVEVRYKLNIINKKTKKETYLDLNFTESEVRNMLKNKIYENCTVLGFPNIRAASGNQVKVFRE